MTSAQPRPALPPVMFNKALVLQIFLGVMSILGVWLLGHGQLTPGRATAFIGYAVAAAGVILALYVVARLRPALPRAQSGQTVTDYLRTPPNLGAATHAWIVASGTGMMCWLGFAMTGVWAAALVGALVLLVYFTLRPSTLIRR